MKKIILFIVLFLIFNPAFGDDNNSNNELSPFYNQNQNEQQDDDDLQLEQTPWNEMYNQIIDEKYGSVESPAFLNRENIDPPKANTGFSDY